MVEERIGAYCVVFEEPKDNRNIISLYAASPSILAIELIGPFGYATATVPYDGVRSNPIPKSCVVDVIDGCCSFGDNNNSVSASETKSKEAVKRSVTV